MTVLRVLTELKNFCFEQLEVNCHKSCFVCANPKTSSLLIHHLKYTKNSIIYNQFENSDIGRLQYYSRLLDEIKSNPRNLIILCYRCHEKLEELLKMKWIDAYTWLNTHENSKTWETNRLEIILEDRP